MIERDRILAIHGPVSWVRYDLDGKQWAAAYIHGSLVSEDEYTDGYWYQRTAPPHDQVKLTKAEVDQIRACWPQEAGLDVLPGLDGLDPQGKPAAESDLFRRWTMAELDDEHDTFDWLVRGMLSAPTYGMVAGEVKTLKSYFKGFLQVGLAAGVPIFGHFKPDQPRPVVAYVGEGGRLLYKRRLRRIAEAMGVNLRDLPIHTSFDIAPIQSAVFTESLARDLADIQPALVSLDPYYAYHGAAVKAADLHAEATVLNALSRPCIDADATLMVCNHMNQTGAGLNLKRITMAGSGEWADSWVLLAHREDPDVANGKFHLSVEIGSRQWGGSSWDLDLDIGRFDEDLGVHDGDITWDLRRTTPGVASQTTDAGSKVQATRHAIAEVLTDMPWRLTKTETYDRVGGNKAAFTKAFNTLVEDGRIRHDQISRDEAGTAKKRLLWGLVANPDQSSGPRSESEAA